MKGENKSMGLGQRIRGAISDFWYHLWNPKKRSVKGYMKRKLAIVLCVIALAFFALMLWTLRLINNKESEYSVEVLSNYRYSTSTLSARRGEIVDRNGTTVATCNARYLLILDARVLLSDAQGKILDATIPALEECFGLKEDDVMSVINANPYSGYIRYNGKTYVTKEQVDKFNQMQAENKKYIKGVWFETEYQRFYPFDEKACRVIGFTTDDGADGLWGLENYYDSYLKGTTGRVTSYLNEDYDLERIVYDAKNGNTVVSTLDMTVQSIIEADIQAYMDEIGADNVGVIMMDPNNGEILTMASSQGYNLNDPWNLENFYSKSEIGAMSEEDKQEALNHIWRNFCISDSYEPGSVAKTFTLAMGLEENIIEPDDTYYCSGYKISGGYKIRCHIREGHGELTVTQALEESCNDCLMQIGWEIGPEIFTNYQQKYNLGQLTGIDLPGEASCSGLLYTLDNMGETELATNSFGQCFNVTMVQMASAVSSLINGGYYYQPHLVKEVVDENGAVVMEKDSTVLRSTVSNETSDEIRNMMYSVVKNGTGGLCDIEGYAIGGKTGAGEKLPRILQNYVISFMSFTPVDDPQYLLYVVIDTPKIADQSSSAQAQYLAREIWIDTLPYLNVFKDPSETGLEIEDPGNPFINDSYEVGVIEELTPEQLEEEEQRANESNESNESDESGESGESDGSDESGEGQDSSDAPADAPSDVPADVPADQPGDQPADVPSDQPADVSSDQPADQPAQENPETPAEEQPAAPASEN